MEKYKPATAEITKAEESMTEEQKVQSADRLLEIANLEKERAIAEAKLLEEGAEYQWDNQGNRTLVLAENQRIGFGRENEEKEAFLERSKVIFNEIKDANKAEEWGSELLKRGFKKEAIEFYNKSLELFEQGEWQKNETQACFNIGRVVVPMLEIVGRKEDAAVLRKKFAHVAIADAEKYVYLAKGVKAMIKSEPWLTEGYAEELRSRLGWASSSLNMANYYLKGVADTEEEAGLIKGLEEAIESIRKK